MLYVLRNFPDGNEALRHIVKDAEELQVVDIKIKAKKAEKKGHLNDRDLANVMKHLKENDLY